MLATFSICLKNKTLLRKGIKGNLKKNKRPLENGVRSKLKIPYWNHHGWKLFVREIRLE